MSKDQSRGKQNDRLLAALMRGEKINPLVSWQTYGIYRLGSRISDLKHPPERQLLKGIKPVPIEDEYIEVSSRFGEKIKVKQFHILKEFRTEEKVEDNQSGFAGEGF